MLDTVFGLPVHVLVVHAVVVLGPVTGFTALAYAVRPPWRRQLRLPLAGLSVLTAGSAVVSAASGEELLERLGRLGVGGSTLEAITPHSERGELARNVALALVVVALASVFLLLRPADGAPGRPGRPGAPGTPGTPGRPGSRTPGGPVVAVVASVVLALAGMALLVTTTLAGHSGSSAVWSDIGAA